MSKNVLKKAAHSMFQAALNCLSPSVMAINLPARYIDNINYQENETLHRKVFSDKKQQVQLSVAKELQSKPIALGLSLGYQNQEIHTHKAQAVFISTGMIWKQGPLQFGAFFNDTATTEIYT
eukprot:COSAG02_NODE_34148_length_489_cov_0.394872_1_plen_122_part_00